MDVGAKTKASRRQTDVDIERVKVKNEGLVRARHRKDIESTKETGKNEVILPASVDLLTPELSLEELLRDYGLFRVPLHTEVCQLAQHDRNRVLGDCARVFETAHSDYRETGKRGLSACQRT
jgi:hypothetical protein